MYPSSGKGVSLRGSESPGVFPTPMDGLSGMRPVASLRGRVATAVPKRDPFI